MKCVINLNKRGPLFEGGAPVPIVKDRLEDNANKILGTNENNRYMYFAYISV